LGVKQRQFVTAESSIEGLNSLRYGKYNFIVVVAANNRNPSQVGMSSAVTVVPERLVSFSDADVKCFDRVTCVPSHSLHTNPETAPLFTDDSVAAILDNYPEEWLFALTMGSDPLRPQDNERVKHSNVSGTDLLEAVRRGKLWLNITNIDQVDARFRALIDRLYADVASYIPGFVVDESHATLLVSSPEAMVYYHVDAPPSFLWHIRGSKRVWVYPHLREDVLPRSLLEDVYAGARQEYVPYELEFDDVADTYDLEPGQVAMWPHNAPHRVSNLGTLNVSLVTDHWTPEARARARVYKANRFLRTKGHIPHARLGTKESGAVAFAKAATHQVGRRLRLDDLPNKSHKAPVRRVDASSVDGLSPL
jgi:hypothetical protein